MDWGIEYTELFLKWWRSLKEEEQITVDASIRLLEHFGSNLRFPYSSGIEGSKFGHMRELRIQHQGKPLGYYMLLIHAEWHFYCLAVISKVIIIGIKNLYRLRINYTSSILNR